MSEEQAEERYWHVGIRELAKERLVALSFANYAKDTDGPEWLDIRTPELEAEVLESYAGARVPFSGG